MSLNNNPISELKPDSITTLFVYGTLLSGEPNHYLLSDAEFICKSQTKPDYLLLDINGHFPAMVSGGSTAVKGEDYKINKRTLSKIDRLENHPDFYKRVEINLQNGMMVKTYLLDLNKTGSYSRIDSGDWRVWNRAKKQAVKQYFKE